MKSKPKLFCFTYAGGTKDFFNVIRPDLKDIDLITLEYAGHGERHKEDYYHDFDELADDMLRMIKDDIDGDYGLFGYSMGSIVLVEVLKRIISSNLKTPDNIFIAAHEPHTKTELLTFSDDELDEWVKERTVKFGAIPEMLLNNKVFWRMYLPVFRADYSIIGKYDFEKLSIQTDIPATVFYSETDTPLTDMKQWGKYFPCEFYQFSGTHFFIQDHHEKMGIIIRDKMKVPECEDGI